MKNYSPITLGKSLTRIDNGRFILTETRHSPNLSLERHSHKHANLVCVLKGSYTENIGTRNYECTANTLLLKPAGEFHFDNYHRGGAHCLIIEFLPKMRELSRAFSRTLESVSFLTSAAIVAATRRIHTECVIGDDVSEVAIEGLTLELLASLARGADPGSERCSPAWMDDLEALIHSSFRETVALSTLSEAVGIDASQISRIFRRKYKCSIGEYVRRLRVEFAAEQLARTDKPLSEISVESGFYDQSHFSRTFKSLTGTTPSKYRSNVR